MLSPSANASGATPDLTEQLTIKLVCTWIGVSIQVPTSPSSALKRHHCPCFWWVMSCQETWSANQPAETRPFALLKHSTLVACLRRSMPRNNLKRNKCNLGFPFWRVVRPSILDWHHFRNAIGFTKWEFCSILLLAAVTGQESGQHRGPGFPPSQLRFPMQTCKN